ncbi:MAG: TIGR03663 family protein [Spartobacteria bacterium]|nr:TIGR03663 family protein [Spartobacteria bacterium]
MKITRTSILYGLALLLIVLLAASARFYDLGRRPLHHDEGANTHFMTQIFKGQTYQYDPCNYHGPLLYYLTWMPLSVMGMESSLYPIAPDSMVGDVSFRVMPALFGALLILLIPAFRKWMGRAGVLFAMLLLAVSPAFLYYSRDNIHEIYLLFFTLLTFLAGYRFYLTKRAGWLYGIGLGLAGMFALKETAILTVAAWGGALGVVSLSGYLCRAGPSAWRRDLQRLLKRVGGVMILPAPLSCVLISVVLLVAWLVAPAFVEQRLRQSWATSLLLKGGVVMMCCILFASVFATLRERLRHVIFSVLLFFLVISVLFTTFFQWSGGVAAFFRAFELWFTTGTVASQHNKPFVYFLQIMLRYEAPVLLFGIGGILFGCRRGRSVTCFVAVWALALLLVYSLIPYKTPWLVLNILLPFALLGGVFVEIVLSRFRKRALRAVALLLLAAVCIRQGTLAYALSFEQYDDDGESLVYVQTTRDAVRMIERIFELAEAYDGVSTPIISVTPDYWPLPWYFRFYPGVLWYGQLIDDLNAPMILAKADQQDDVEMRLKDRYNKEYFTLRPGAPLLLYHRALPDEVQQDRFTFTNTLALHPGQEIAPGLVGHLYRGAFFAGRSLRNQVDTTIDINWPDEAAKPCRAPLSMEWKGLLHAPEAGRYTLITISDDGSWIYLGDRLVVDNGGEHAQRRQSQTVWLAKGYHPMTVRYFDAYYGAVMQLKWRPPNAPESFITNNLFHVLPF